MINCTSLWKKSLYTIKSEFVINDIYEYDIAKANISILLNRGIISLEEYKYYSELDRKSRQVKIGLLQKDNPDLIKILNDGFEQARKELCISNQLIDDEIISIRKDSLFVTRLLNITNFNNIHFLLKHHYALMVKIDELEIYFGDFNNDYNIDIKGINDDKIPLHYNGYLTMLCEVLFLLQSKQFEQAIQYINKFMYNYSNLNLPLDFYREFNSKSMYRLKSFDNSTCYYVDFLNNSNDLINIDTSYNEKVNSYIYKLLSMIYFTYCC